MQQVATTKVFNDQTPRPAPVRALYGDQVPFMFEQTVSSYSLRAEETCRMHIRDLDFFIYKHGVIHGDNMIVDLDNKVVRFDSNGAETDYSPRKDYFAFMAKLAGLIQKSVMEFYLTDPEYRDVVAELLSEAPDTETPFFVFDPALDKMQSIVGGVYNTFMHNYRQAAGVLAGFIEGMHPAELARCHMMLAEHCVYGEAFYHHIKMDQRDAEGGYHSMGLHRVDRRMTYGQHVQDVVAYIADYHEKKNMGEKGVSWRSPRLIYQGQTYRMDQNNKTQADALGRVVSVDTDPAIKRLYDFVGIGLNVCEVPEGPSV